mmetsp:Transcript_6091/g.9533  ORF Transcript_6091/g.9533 Transcript_6091/m.9533 type:complete len:258 (+) Transcript_6091:83-856(+)
MADELISLFGKITTNDHDQLVDQFSKVMQVEHHVATFFLEASSWNVETAVHNYLASTSEGNARGNPIMLRSPPQAQFLSDLSPYQSRPFQPRTKLPVRLRFQNVGTSAWPADTCLSFVDGDRMGGAPDIQVAAQPGQMVDIILALFSPEQEGTSMGTWRLACSAGYFGDAVFMILSSSNAAEPVNFDQSEFQPNWMTNMQYHQQQQQQQQQQPNGQVDQLLSVGNLRLDSTPPTGNHTQTQQTFSTQQDDDDAMGDL